tara:strand:+ start:2801 stop:3409 length:609 start_codon:yes stop_codon:yes gene_type:complete
MAKRFTDTTKWNEDWFCDLDIVEKLFWIYICDSCDYTGIFKINKKFFEFICQTKIDIEDFLFNVNKDKERIVLIKNNKWFIKDFIKFQYGTSLNPRNNVHKSVIKTLKHYNILGGMSIEKVNDGSNKPSSIQEVEHFFKRKGSTTIQAQSFYYFYESKGWKVGKQPMKNWKMSASGWISRSSKTKVNNKYLSSQIKAMKDGI